MLISFHVGGDTRKSLNFGLGPKEGVFFGKLMFSLTPQRKNCWSHSSPLCKDMDSMELLFSLFGVTWVLSYSVKETLLGWHGSFVGKACKKSWKVVPIWIFSKVWKERNLLAFDNTEFLVQMMKNSFVCNLWSWFGWVAADLYFLYTLGRCFDISFLY